MHFNEGGGIFHVSTLRELGKLKTAYKIRFLKSQRLEIFTSLINRNLRNDIAHLKFTVDDLGIIRDSNNQAKDIDVILRDFWQKVDVITRIFDEINFLSLIRQRGMPTSDRTVSQNHSNESEGAKP